MKQSPTYKITARCNFFEVEHSGLTEKKALFLLRLIRRIKKYHCSDVYRKGTRFVRKVRKHKMRNNPLTVTIERCLPMK